jgi:hypothetical protein
MCTHRPLDRIIVYNVTDYQRALNMAVQAYQDDHGVPPTVVQLPTRKCPTNLNLMGLTQDRVPAPWGCLIVGVAQ